MSWGFIITSYGWGVILATGGLLSILCTKRKIKKDICIFLLFVMILVMVCNRNYDIRSSGLRAFFSNVFPIICVSLGYVACIHNSERNSWFIRLSLIFGCVFAVFTIVFIISPDLYYGIALPILKQHYSVKYTRMIESPSAGITADYGLNSCYISYGLGAAVSTAYVFFKTKKKKKYVYFCLSIILLLALLFNTKRTALFGVLGGFVIVYMIFEKKRDKYFRIVLIGLCVLVAFMIAISLVPSLSVVYDRLAFIFDGSQDKNLNSRFALWEQSWDAFKNSPFIGNGWRWVKHSLFSDNRDVHNTFLQLLAENGIIGAFPFFMFFIIQYRRALKLVRSVKDNIDIIPSEVAVTSCFCLFLQTYMIIYMAVTTSFYSQNTAMYYILVCALTTREFYQIKEFTETRRYNKNES